MALLYRAKNLIGSLVIVILLTVFIVNLEYFNELRYSDILDGSPFGRSKHHGGSNNEKLGFVTFLSSRSNDSEHDPYFEMTRVMAFKLLHNEETKTKLQDTPFIVLATEAVTEKKKQRLRDDGAIVREVETISSGNSLIGGAKRWVDVMTKFRVWELIEYDRLLYLDSDIYIVRNMDRIFDDPASHVLPKIQDIPEESDEDSSDDEYLLAASDFVQYNWAHSIPVAPCPRLNAGLLLLKPSLNMFNRYVGISRMPERYDTGEMDQGVLNYAHNKSSATPWSRLEPGKWVANFPEYGDYEAGVATLHDKMWYSADRQLYDMYQNDLAATFEALGE